MIVTGHQINDALEIVPLAPAEAAKVCKSENARVWLDDQGFDSGELEPWLEELGLMSLSKQRCLEARDRAGFYPLTKQIFFCSRGWFG